VAVGNAPPITVASVEEAMRDALARGRKSIDDVAQLLFVSASTLQRRLAHEDTTFTEVRQRVQVEVALELLTKGKAAASVAEEVCLSTDHLCVLVRRAADLTPLQIVRAATLTASVQRWRRSGPPTYGSPLYLTQFRKWRSIDRELRELLEDLDASHPLADWAKQMLTMVARPDFRRQPHRRRIRTERAKEQARQRARLDEFFTAIFQRPGHPGHGPDNTPDSSAVAVEKLALSHPFSAKSSQASTHGLQPATPDTGPDAEQLASAHSRADPEDHDQKDVA
jgi:AraC-like DNA-binding protein